MHANSLAPDSNPPANPSGSGLFAWMRRKFCAKPSVNTIRLLLLLALLYARALVGPGGKGFEDFLVLTYILAIVYFWTIPARDRHLYFLTIPNKKTLGIVFIVGALILTLDVANVVIFYDGVILNPWITILHSPLHFVVKFIFNAFPEEIFFRGFLWGELRRFNLSHFSILCITSILFMGGHWYYYERPDLMIRSLLVGGLVFGTIAWRTKPLLSSSIVHSMNNMLPMIVYGL